MDPGHVGVGMAPGCVSVGMAPASDVELVLP
jgi:hypothetical protein